MKNATIPLTENFIPRPTFLQTKFGCRLEQSLPRSNLFSDYKIKILSEQFCRKFKEDSETGTASFHFVILSVEMSKNTKKRSMDAQPAGSAGEEKYIVEFTKTTIPTVTRKKNKSNDQWDIKVFHRRIATEKKKEQTTYIRGSELQAKREAALFRIAWEWDNATHWVSFAQRKKNHCESFCIYEDLLVNTEEVVGDVLSISITEPSVRPLNAVEEMKFKKMKTVISREEFINYFSITCIDYKEDVKARIERSLNRSLQKREEKYRASFATLAYDKAVVNFIKTLKERKNSNESNIDMHTREKDELRKVFTNEQCYKYLIIENDSKAEAIMDAKEGVHGYSSKQLHRVNTQVLVCAQVSERLILRYKEELKLVDEMMMLYETVHGNEDALLSEKHAYLNNMIDKYHECMNEIRKRHAMPIIAQKLSTDVLMGTVKPFSILTWWNQFKQYGKFLPDMRGKYEHQCALDTLNVGNLLALYMRSERLLTVDKTVEMLTSLFAEDKYKDNEIVKSLLPLTRSSVHNWMLKYGATFD